MNGLVGFVVCALILTGVSGNPMTSKLFNPACGLQAELPKAEFDAFNPFEEVWPLNVKCYHQCELEQMGALENGKFSAQFKMQLAMLDLVPSEELKGLATLLLGCVEEANGEGECETAYLFGKCMSKSVLGAAGLAALAGFGGPQ